MLVFTSIYMFAEIMKDPSTLSLIVSSYGGDQFFCTKRGVLLLPIAADWEELRNSSYQDIVREVNTSGDFNFYILPKLVIPISPETPNEHHQTCKIPQKKRHRLLKLPLYKIKRMRDTRSNRKGGRPKNSFSWRSLTHKMINYFIRMGTK